MGNTTKLWGYSSSYALAQAVWGHNGTSWLPAKGLWVYDGNAWRARYSVIASTLNSNIAKTGSGASTSGSVSDVGGVSSVSGNLGSVTYSWAYLSGDGSIAPNNSAAAQPTWARSFSGVANGSTSSTVTATWRCTITDAATGANQLRDYSISFAWQNTIPAFSPFTSTYYTGSGSETVPTGASQLVIEAFGRGGFPGSFDVGSGSGGGGGGGAGRSVKTIAIGSGDWGQSLSWSISGDATISGALSVSMTAQAGGNGDILNVGGSAGSASGGDSNFTGSAGSYPNGGNAASGGGAGGGADADGTAPGGGGGGATFNGSSGGNPGSGRIKFMWT